MSQLPAVLDTVGTVVLITVRKNVKIVCFPLIAVIICNSQGVLILRLSQYRKYLALSQDYFRSAQLSSCLLEDSAMNSFLPYEATDPG